MVLNLIPRGIVVALVALSALFVAAAPALAATDGDTTETTITSPSDPTFTYVDGDKDWDDDANFVTVKGTADSNGNLELVCVYGGSGDGGRELVEVDEVYAEDFTRQGENLFTWEKRVAKSAFYADQRRSADARGIDVGDVDHGRTCRLHATPDEQTAYEGDLSSFTGPRVGIGFFGSTGGGKEIERLRSGSTAAKRGIGLPWESDSQSYLAAFPQLKGAMAFTTVGDGGLIDAMPFNPSTLAAMNQPSWVWGSALWPVDLFGTGPQTLVDGAPAFNAFNAPVYLYYSDLNRGGGEIEGQPELKVTLESFNPNNGEAILREEQDLVECAVPEGEDLDFFSLSRSTCPELVPTGVKHVRFIHQHFDGRVAEITDEFSSTDGAAHNVDLQVDSGIDGGEPAWKVPGAADYARFGEYDEVSLPGDQTGSFVTKDVGEGGGEFGGLDLEEILYQCADVHGYDFCVGHFFDCIDEMGESFCIAYFLDYWDNYRSTKREFRADGSGDRATGSLTYAQKPDRAVFSGDDGVALEYNRNVPATGKTVLKHAFGTATTIGEIEALATLLQRSYTPAEQPAAAQQTASTPAAAANDPAPPAPVFRRPSQTPLRFKSLSSRVRGRGFTLTVSCTGGAQGGTIKIRTRMGKRFTLGTRAYQCPAGGQRTVTFTLTRSQLRKLRKLGRRVRLSTYTVARDAEGKPVSIGQIINLTTR